MLSAPSATELDAYRERVDRFIADLDQEYYDHFAGLKVDFDLESVYRNYEDITTLARPSTAASARRSCGASRARGTSAT